MEITITVALFVETGAMIEGYRQTQQADLGFTTAPLMTAALENPGGVPAGPVLEILTHLPGVASAAAATAMPYAGGGRAAQVATEAGGADAVTAQRSAIA